MELTLFLNFVLATALGMLIGIERDISFSEWADEKIEKNHEKNHEKNDIGGIRLYALMGFFGAFTAWLDILGGSDYWKILGIAIVAFFLSISYMYSTFRLNKLGIVSEFAAIVAYLYGIIVMLGYYHIAIILTILSLVLFSAKEHLGNFTSKISRVEMGNSIKFAVIALVVLPLLPDVKYSLSDIFTGLSGSSLAFSHPILAMKFFNPYSVWFFVVIMAGIEYIGYILSKILGNKGSTIISGAVGGMISSTAVTAAMTSKSHENANNTHFYVAATLIASVIMCVRVIAVSGFYSPAILSTILIPSTAMLVGLGGATWYFYRKWKKTENSSKIEETSEEYDSPFRIAPAIKFALVIVGIKFIAGIGLIYQHIIDPKIFYYVLGMISGLADVDAITMDMAGKSLDGSLSLVIASTTILIATMSNNIVKASIAYRMWEKSFGKNVLIGFGISILLGLAGILVVNVM